MASQQMHYEVLTNVYETTNMTTRRMRVSRNRENLQPYWIPEGFRAVLISVNDIQRLPFQQNSQEIQQQQQQQQQQRRSETTTQRRCRQSNQTNAMPRQGRRTTVLGAPLDQITNACANNPARPNKRKELSGNENDENSQNPATTVSASASASTSMGSPLMTAPAKKKNGVKKTENQRATISPRNNENKTPEHNISDPMSAFPAATVIQMPSNQCASLSQQVNGSSIHELKFPKKATSEHDTLYAMHGSNRVSKNTSSMHNNKPTRVLESRVESTVLPNSQHNSHSTPRIEGNFPSSNDGCNYNEHHDEMEAVELERDQVMKL